MPTTMRRERQDDAIPQAHLDLVLCDDHAFVVERDHEAFSVFLVLDNGAMEMLSGAALGDGAIEVAVASCAALFSPRPPADIRVRWPVAADASETADARVSSSA